MTIIILYFFQEGCMACQEQEPINREVEQDINVRIEAIDPTKNPVYIREYNLKVTPTIIILDDGRETERFEGVVHREQFEEALKQLG